MLGVAVRRQALLWYQYREHRGHTIAGILNFKTLLQVEKLSTASFCRRRLAVAMVRLKMSQTLREACTFIEQVCGSSAVRLSVCWFHVFGGWMSCLQRRPHLRLGNRTAGVP